MRICMVFYDMQDFGGLEEYSLNLALGLQAQGHQVSMLSAAWVPPQNQYFQRLKAANIPLVQPPRWISNLASNWDTKERILRGVMILFSPLVLLLGIGVSLLQKRLFTSSLNSARNWLKGRLMDRFIGPDYRRFLGRFLLTVWRFRWRPDLLHIHGYTTSQMFVLDWAHRRRIPIVYEEHSTPDPRFEGWKNAKSSLNKAARVVAVSEKSAEALRVVCGVTRPIDISGPLLPDPFQTGWRRNGRYAGEGNQINVTTFARLIPEKGLDYLLEAIIRVNATHPNVRFNVYGEGELRQTLLDCAQKLRLNGEKIFAGTFSGRAELTRILSATDIFVLSSLIEGQPVVIVEAMAYGCPIVATAVGGIPELIQDGVNGLLCPSADSNRLVEKINTLIGDPELRARLGAAARASYEQGPFQVNAVSSKFVTIYKEALGEVVV